MDNISNELSRLLVLDTSGIYTNIVDEIYIPKEFSHSVGKKYEGYMIVEIKGTENEEVIKFL